MNASQRETASLIERVRRVMREPRTVFEQWEVQLKASEQPLKRNPEITHQIAGNHHRQSEEIGLRTETARVSLRPEEQTTLILPRERSGKRSRIIKGKQMPKATVKSKNEGRQGSKRKVKDPLLYRLPVARDS
jgi:hypothetical protein